MLCEGRAVGKELLGPLSRLSATQDAIPHCAYVLLCQCHLRSGWGRSHQGSLCSRRLSARLLRCCCDTHRAWLGSPLTGRMAFLSLGNHGSSRDFDGQDNMYTCKWLPYLDKTTIWLNWCVCVWGGRFHCFAMTKLSLKAF